MSVRPKNLLWTIFSRLPKLITDRGLHTKEDAEIEWPDSSLLTRLRGRSIFIRHLDTGSSNATELGIAALGNAVYDFQCLGFHMVASPRHADMLLVTGPMTYNLIPAAEATFDAMPEKPRYVVTVGDDAEDGGIFRDAYGVLGDLPREDMKAARIGHVAGPAPKPSEILEGLCDTVNALKDSKRLDE
jgi:Ni,Fe-hydrogenase III small subunit